jgi:hypothetical protein
MTQQDAASSGTARKGVTGQPFSHVTMMLGGTWMYASAGSDHPLAGLVGKVVNIGDKDGGVYEGVTVAAVDERTGYLTVRGGSFGILFRDSEAAPFEGDRLIAPYDIARGIIRPAAT